MCHVTGEYGLSDNKPEHEQQVATLLLQDKFIFLPKEGVCFHLLYLYIDLICTMQGIDPKKPFHHPAIINTIQEAFFKRKRGPSIAQKHQSLFTSSQDTGTAGVELELPPAMVAMAAVAVSLLQLSDPLLTTPTRFMHRWMRQSLVLTSMLIPMKTHTTHSFHSWSRFRNRNS
jgi:hypothetical protein